MSRHVSLDNLALLSADALKPRKVAKVESHLQGCSQCRQEQASLASVPGMLASVPYQSMPENLSSRIDSAIAAESTRRAASQPSAEQQRRELPTRQRVRRSRRLPTVTSPLSRALVTAGGVAIVVAGGVVIANQIGGPSTTSNSASGTGHGAAASVSRPPSPPALRRGPVVYYGHGRSAQHILLVTASTNFQRPILIRQVGLALIAAHHSGVHSVSTGKQAQGTTSRSVNSTTSPGSLAATPFRTAALPPASRLTGCINRLAPGEKLQLLEHARFDGQPATVIVTAAPAGHPEQVWVVGNACSATNSAVFFHGTLSST